MGHFYEGLLGLPPDIPAPDYYQLLGLAPDAVDETSVKDALAARLDRLDAAPGSGSTLAQHLRRELQRARATLLDPKRRADYAEEIRNQRRTDAKRYVAELVSEGVLGSATEAALVQRLSGLGLPGPDVREAIEESLAELQATRGDESSDAALGLEADARVLEVMHHVADERLLAVVGVPGRLESADDASAAPRAPEPAPRAVPAPAPEPVPSPPAESIWQDSSQIGTGARSGGARVASKDERTPSERERRSARRWSRTWQALFLIAMGFVAASVVTELAPDLAARVELATAPLRVRVRQSPDATRYVVGAGAAAALLLGLVAFLAGRSGRKGFLVPTLLLVAPAAYAGFVPGGQKELLRRERNGLADKTAAVAVERDGAIAELTSARKAASDRSAELATLEKRRATETGELARKLDAALRWQQTLEKKLDEETALARKATEQEPVLAERAAKIAELQKALKAQETVVQKLRTENAELKKRASGTTTALSR